MQSIRVGIGKLSNKLITLNDMMSEIKRRVVEQPRLADEGVHKAMNAVHGAAQEIGHQLDLLSNLYKAELLNVDTRFMTPTQCSVVAPGRHDERASEGKDGTRRDVIMT